MDLQIVCWGPTFFERKLRMRKEIFILCSLLLCTVFTPGCFSSNPDDINAFTKPARAELTMDSYILYPPDEIEIQCLKVPELHLARQQIRPDGRVSFEGIGEIYAAGKTPAELAEIMRQKILAVYRLTNQNPIDVRIVVYRSKVYYVIGEVTFSGPRTVTGRDTVFRALTEAIPTVLAWKRRIQVIRPSADPAVPPKIFEVDYVRMSAHGDMNKNVLLQEGDVVFVPPTVLASAAMRVEEFVRPIGRAFSTVNIIQGPPERRD